MRKLFIGIAFAILLSGCGTTVQGSVTQMEAAFTSAVSVVNDARRPCKLKGEEDPGCLIKSDTYLKIAPIVHGIDDSLDRAKSFLAAQQVDEAETWLQTVQKLLGQLNEYLGPVRKSLGV